MDLKQKIFDQVAAARTGQITVNDATEAILSLLPKPDTGANGQHTAFGYLAGHHVVGSSNVFIKNNDAKKILSDINPQTIEDHEANSVRGIEAYTEQREKRKVKAVMDDSGHWYVIPNEMLNEFMQDEQNENMVDSGEFGAKWDEYRTRGNLNLVQLWSEL